MKTRTNFAWVAIIAAIGITLFGFIACDDGNKKTDQEHSGDPIYVGTVDGIPVYRVDGVSVAEAEAALAVFEEAYGWLTESQLSNLAPKLNEVHLVSGNGVTHEGKILKIGVNNPDSMDIWGYMSNL